MRRLWREATPHYRRLATHCLVAALFVVTMVMLVHLGWWLLLLVPFLLFQAFSCLVVGANPRWRR